MASDLSRLFPCRRSTDTASSAVNAALLDASFTGEEEGGRERAAMVHRVSMRSPRSPLLRGEDSSRSRFAFAKISAFAILRECFSPSFSPEDLLGRIRLVGKEYNTGKREERKNENSAGFFREKSANDPESGRESGGEDSPGGGPVLSHTRESGRGSRYEEVERLHVWIGEGALEESGSRHG